MVTIATHEAKYIEPQVDLIWKVTDKWKYGYQTSYETVRNAYLRDGFDPKSRFYAFDGEELVGFAGVNISENSEKEKIGSMRLPIAIDGDMEIIQSLIDRIESYLKDKGASKIRAPSGVGLGNTIEVAEKLGFVQGPEVFRRTYTDVKDLKISGKTDDVTAFTENDKEDIRNLFMTQMGMPEAQGEGFFNWALNNHERKNKNKPNSSSWQIIRSEDGIQGFSFLMKSDHLPWIANSMPIFFKGEGDKARDIIDQLLSAHLKTLDGVKVVGNYLLPNLYKLEGLYNSFGYTFDPSYMNTKDL